MTSALRSALVVLAVAALTACTGAGPDRSTPSAHQAGMARSGAHPAGPVEVAPGPEARSARGAVTAMFRAYDRKDLPRWIGSWTDRGFRRAFGVSKSEAALVPPSWGDVRSFRESQVQVVSLVVHGRHQVEVTAGAAHSEHAEGMHAVVETTEFGIRTRQRLDLRREHARWRVAGRTLLPVTVGDRAVLVAELGDFSIRTSTSAVAGSVAIHAVNAGRHHHELLLLRDRGGTDETVGRIHALAPGESWDLVADGLPSGTYTLVCNLLDDEGRPHSAVGMRAIVDVGGAGAS